MLLLMSADAPCCEQSRTAATDCGSDCVLEKDVVDTLAISTSFVHEGNVPWQPATSFALDFHSVAAPVNCAGDHPSVWTRTQQYLPATQSQTIQMSQLHPHTARRRDW